MRARQSEPELNKILFTRLIASQHPAKLRQRDVGFVDDRQKILGKKVEQCKRRLTGFAAIEPSRVILDAATKPRLLNHGHIIRGAPRQPLGLQQLSFLLQLGHALLELGTNTLERRLHHTRRGHVVLGREHPHVVDILDVSARDPIQLRHLDQLIPFKFDAIGHGQVDRHHFHHIAAHTEGAALQLARRALKLHGDKLVHNPLASPLFALFNVQHVGLVLLGRSQRIDARHARHNDHIATCEQRLGGRMPQPVNLVVDLRFLFYVGVRARHIRLRLVVVVIGNKVFHHVIWKELPQLAAQLRGKRFVVGDDEGRALDMFNDIRDRVSLSRSRHTQQRLCLVTPNKTLDKSINGLWLITSWLVGRVECEVHNVKAPAP